ncbi:putative ribonuclease H-like domain-containing protein [Tanacetum coccineum]
MDVKSAFLYGKIEEEVYVCQPPGFEDPDFPDRVYKVENGTPLLDCHPLLELGLVKQKEDGIFISQDKYVTEILRKFGFSDVKTASTPMETHKPLLKDADGKDVDEHLYRSMIGSLMYLTSSRPDIMFVVLCACARYQVNPKVSYLHAVKRIFRYLKCQPKLGLLVAYTDSDYAGACLDRKSITGAEYIAASNCCGQFWDTVKAKTVNEEVQLQALVDKKKVIITESTIRRDLQLEDANGVDCLPNAAIFEQLTLMGYEKLSQKLTFYKAFFSPQWKFLIHTILQCLSAKTTAWNEFSSTMASAIICLATNQKFNFSKYIFDNMVKNVDSMVKFWMYPRFVQVFVNKQVGDMSHHKKIYVTPSHTKKIFANMKREGKGFSGTITPLFQTMMVQAQEEIGEGSANPTDPHHTPTITQPSTSQPQKKQPRRKQKKDTEREEISQELRRLESSDEASLGDQEDASKQGRKIADIDANAEVTLVDETQGGNDEEMFDTSILNGEEVFAEQGVVEKEVSVVDPVTTAGEVVTTASVEVSTAEVAIDSATTTTVDELTLAQTVIEIKAAKPKDKCKAKMTEPEKPLKKKDQIMLLAGILQAREQEELIDEKKARLIVELLEKRQKHFAALRAQEKRNKPPTKAQKKSTMSTYLKHMAGYKQIQLKNKSFAKIQKLFDKAMTRVIMFVDIDTELVKGSEKRAEDSTKRAGTELEQEVAKKQKIDDDQEEAKLKELMEVISDKKGVTIDAIPLSTKPPSIVDYKIIKSGKINIYQIIKANGSSKRYSAVIHMLKNYNREDMETLWKIVKARHGYTRLEEGYERVI